MSDNMTELAKLLKERENQSVPSIILGKIISTPPEVKIQLNEHIVLNKENLVFSSSLLNGYAREIGLKGNIQFTDSNCGTTNSVHDGGYQASSHSHTISTLNVDTTFTGTANMQYSDGLKVNDEVILMPTTDEQTYYVLDKAVRL